MSFFGEYYIQALLHPSVTTFEFATVVAKGDISIVVHINVATAFDYVDGADRGWVSGDGIGYRHHSRCESSS